MLMIASVLNTLLDFVLRVMSENRNRFMKLVVCYLLYLLIYSINNVEIILDQHL